MSLEQKRPILSMQQKRPISEPGAYCAEGAFERNKLLRNALGEKEGVTEGKGQRERGGVGGGGGGFMEEEGGGAEEKYDCCCCMRAFASHRHRVRIKCSSFLSFLKGSQENLLVVVVFYTWVARSRSGSSC